MSRKSSSSSSSGPSSNEAPPVPKKDDIDIENDGKKLKYPRSVFFIVVNEFCERFCYYGMRTVLSLYFRDILKFDEDLATVLYHTFIMLCYFTPIIGSVISDNYIGKFRTILYLSLIYALGSIVLACAAIPNGIPQVEFSMVGLFLIAFGTGGIKPCVSAFGGDQFVRPQQDKQLEQFFSVFYFAVNAGSLISTFVTPILREDVHCFGDDSCFPLAFGLPAALMLIAIVVFIIGKPLYKIKLPEGNIIIDFCKCIGRGIKRRFTAKGEKHDHFLDYAADKYDKELVEDTKRVLSVGWLFLPLPVFWALYDQQGSRWTFQATRMNGDLGGGFVLKPDQVQIVNPILILILVPIFEALIYPLFKKCNLLTPLQRIACGLVFCGLSFVVSGLVEISIQPTYEKLPGPDMTQLNFINTLPCPVNLTYRVGTDGTYDQQIFLDEKFRYNATDFFPADQNIRVDGILQLTDGKCGDLTVNVASALNVDLEKGVGDEAYAVLITLRQNELTILRLNETEHLKKSDNGNPMIAFIYDVYQDANFQAGTFTLKQWSEKNQKYGYVSSPFFFNETNATVPEDQNIVHTKALDVEIGSFDVLWELQETPDVETKIGEVADLIQGGVYYIIVQQPLNGTTGLTPSVLYLGPEDGYLKVEVTSANTVSVAWLLPQYFVVTVGEVMFSVTGLTFAFTQAPATMKSVVTAMWLLVVAFGNLIDIIVASVPSTMSRADEFFLFAGIMGVAVIIFTIMALPYKYVETDEEKKARELAELEKANSGKDNKAVSVSTLSTAEAEKKEADSKSSSSSDDEEK